jgi:hypothetical protein
MQYDDNSRRGHVPVARSPEGRLLAATWALPKVDYECPECHAWVRLRRESRRAKACYFHVPVKAPAVAPRCRIDRYTHNTAVKMLIEAVREWLEGKGPAPEIRCKCTGCGAIDVRPLQSNVRQVRGELYVTNLGRTPDVVLSDERGRPLLFVEVFHTSEVSPAKVTDYAASSYTWIEVSALAILDTPLVWVVRRGSRSWTCGRCARTQAAASRPMIQPVEVSLPTTCKGPEPCSTTPAQPRCAYDAVGVRAHRRAILQRRADEIGPTVRRIVANRFPGYTVLHFAGCFECGGVTAILSWRGQAPPEPRPSWLVCDADGRWLFKCLGCKGPLELASAARDVGQRSA